MTHAATGALLAEPKLAKEWLPRIRSREYDPRFLPAGEGVAFPIGTFDTFTTYGGPANLLEAANTMGLPLYARQHLDEKGRWIDLMTEASILPVNKRPRIAIRIHTSN